MANAFVHSELATTDVDKAKAFYGKLFDWKLEDVPMDGMVYTTIAVGDATGGGIMQQMTPGAPSAWMPYVGVGDIQASTNKARSLGATILRDVTPVAELGWMTILKDPTGAVIGLWQPKK